MISIGYLVGAILMGLLVLAGLVATVITFMIGRNEDEPMIKWGGSGAWLAGTAVAFGFWAWAAHPSFDMDYHTYNNVTGIVEKVDGRMVTEGEGMSEKIVVLLDDGQEYGCLDTRCTLIELGHVVEMSCIKGYSYYGADYFDCDFISTGKPE